METLKKNWPLFACTAAIVLAQIAGSLYVVRQLGSPLHFISSEASSIRDYAQRLDRRTMTDAEAEAYGKDMQRALEILGGGQR